MPTTDPAKNREYRNRSYSKNKQKEIERSRTRAIEYRIRNREIVKSAKQVPCSDCGIEYPDYVMDFDHCRDAKITNISVMVHKPVSVDTLTTEIDKCDVVCANCHRERTFSRMDKLE